MAKAGGQEPRTAGRQKWASTRQVCASTGFCYIQHITKNSFYLQRSFRTANKTKLLTDRASHLQLHQEASPPLVCCHVLLIVFFSFICFPFMHVMFPFCCKKPPCQHHHHPSFITRQPGQRKEPSCSPPVLCHNSLHLQGTRSQQ